MVIVGVRSSRENMLKDQGPDYRRHTHHRGVFESHSEWLLGNSELGNQG